jgi:hypothetical protein
MGRSNSDAKPKMLPAQWIPTLSYICRVKSGNTAPRVYLRMPFAANAGGSQHPEASKEERGF